MSACSGEPVSWMRLERYVLGELSGAEQRVVTEHLAGCATCRACSEHIVRDVREVLALPLLAAALGSTAAGRAMPVRSRKWMGAGPWAALASASLAMWLMFRAPPPPPEAAPRVAVSSTKGGSIALTLVRRDGEGRLLEPERFAPGDRFKVLLTCAPPLQGPVRVQIFQGGEVFEPVPEQSLSRCGNRLALTGAWQFDGPDPLDICVVFSAQSTASRLAQVRSTDALAALSIPHACVRLEPSE